MNEIGWEEGRRGDWERRLGEEIDLKRRGWEGREEGRRTEEEKSIV